MRIKVPIAALSRPSHIAVLTALMSFAAWLYPSFGVLGKGFTVRQRLDLFSVVLLVAWYLVIWLSFYAGQQVGVIMAPARSARSVSLVTLDSNTIYYLFTVLSCIGCMAAYYEILRSLSLSQAIVYLSLGQANELKDGLYENYAPGLASLRYLVVYSASLSFRRLVCNKKLSLLIIINIITLLLIVLLSSRLIFVATLLTTFFLLNFNRRFVSVNVFKCLIWIAIVFSCLSVLNFSRNARFYRDASQSFWNAGISEVLRYLGSPFQVELGASKAIDQIVAQGSESYRNYVDVEINLNTNSAFVALHEQMGYMAWPCVAATCFLMGTIFSILLSFGDTVFLLPCGAILYASAELWRLDLFAQGIFIVWFVAGLGIPISLLVLRKFALSALGGTSEIND